MPTRKDCFISVAEYVRAGQDIATAIANAIADANALPGAIVFIAPNLPAGGTLAAAAAQVAVMDFRPGGTVLAVPAGNVVSGLGDNGLSFAGATTGAGASTGTLTNAPGATNPNFWLKVSINGVNRFIPAW
jgi:hypothetical protein